MANAWRAGLAEVSIAWWVGVDFRLRGNDGGLGASPPVVGNPLPGLGEMERGVGRRVGHLVE